MNHPIFILAVLFVSMSTGFSQSAPSASRSTDHREIERLEIEWNRINEDSDVEGIESLLADDSYHVGPSGRVYTKGQDIAAQRASQERKLAAGSTLRFIISSRKIRLFENVAVVTATGLSSTTLSDGTKRYGNAFRVVHVWEKRDGRWLLIVDQVTGIVQ